MRPPRPAGRAGGVGWIGWIRAFRRDLLSAQPDRLFRARMAEFRTPVFRSFLVNDPALVRRVLVDEAEAFPKSRRVTRGLAALLGRSVFVTDGETHARQRRMIDAAFEGGGEAVFAAILGAAEGLAGRLEAGEADVEPLLSHAAADAIFRLLLSVPIEDRLARETFEAFRVFQRAQPVLTPAALHPRLPAWQTPRARRAARRLRLRIAALVARRQRLIAAGAAPDDLGTRLMTACDPETGRRFDPQETVDQFAIFFLAGHETSAAAIGWALWCLAADPRTQDRAADEARAFAAAPSLSAAATLSTLRAVFREALRLYPPVPMLVREAQGAARFRDRDLRPGDQVVVSPWHLHRHERQWTEPHDFRPGRAAEGCFLPFGQGPRACPGAGFAMTEGAVMLAVLLSRWRFETAAMPVPVAHLTLRARDGIRLRIRAR